MLIDPDGDPLSYTLTPVGGASFPSWLNFDVPNCTLSGNPPVGADDVTFESHGVTILVDPKSLPYLDGTELDYAREGLNEGFKFNNPNVKDACGCGESFNV